MAALTALRQTIHFTAVMVDNMIGLNITEVMTGNRERDYRKSRHRFPVVGDKETVPESKMHWKYFRNFGKSKGV